MYIDKPPSTKSYRVIVDYLQRCIENGQYRTGQKLPSEKELSKMFGASRSSVREALSALEYVGLLEVRSGSGYYVSGNVSFTGDEDLLWCATKVVVVIDDSWNIKSIKGLLEQGVDGITLVVDADSCVWSKQIRAVKQAAHDAGVAVPILLQLAASDDCAGIGQFVIQANIDGIIVGGVNDPGNILSARRFLDDAGTDLPLFARISVVGDNVEDILRVSDGLIVDYTMISNSLAPIVGQMLAKAKLFGKIVMLAATMQTTLNSPDLAGLSTRLNLTDYDGVLLTLCGNARKFPLALLRLLKSTLKNSEERLTAQPEHLFGRVIGSPLANALCVAAVHAAEAMRAMAYVVPTENGRTPRLLAQFRPPLPIIAVSPDSHVVRQLRLVWGVQPLISRRTLSHEEVLPLAVNTALKANHLHDGDAVVGVISGTDVSQAGNTISLLVVGDIIVRGQGIGGGIVTGRVSIIKSLFDMRKSVKNRILVIGATDAEHTKLIEEAAALIVEEGGLSSHAAIACLSLGKPVIVGAANATELLLEDEQVTVDVMRGTVYRGWVNLG